jgi:hypothetical protein
MAVMSTNGREYLELKECPKNTLRRMEKYPKNTLMNRKSIEGKREKASIYAIFLRVVYHVFLF